MTRSFRAGTALSAALATIVPAANLPAAGAAAAEDKPKFERFYPDDPRFSDLFAVDPADTPLAELSSGDSPFPSPKDAPRYRVTFKGEIAGLEIGRIFIETAISREAYDLDYRMEQKGVARFFSEAEAVARAAGVFGGGGIAGSYYHNYDFETEDDQQRTELYRAPGATRLRLWTSPQYWFEFPVPEARVTGAVDPLSALVSLGFGQAAPGKKPCDREARVFDGRRRFDLVLRHEGVERLKAGGSGRFEGEAYRCRVVIEKIAGYKPGETQNGDNGDLWVYLAPVPSAVRGPNFAYVPVRVVARKGLVGASLEGKHPTITTAEGEELKLYPR